MNEERKEALDDGVLVTFCWQEISNDLQGIAFIPVLVLEANGSRLQNED